MARDTKDPDAIDIHIGSRMRSRRKALGMSQQALAEHLGISFQQIQKYERGANRISGSMMFHAAQALGLPTVQFFYEDMGGAGEAGGQAETGIETSFFSADGGHNLAKDFLALPRPQQRVVANMARDLRASGQPSAAD